MKLSRGFYLLISVIVWSWLCFISLLQKNKKCGCAICSFIKDFAFLSHLICPIGLSHYFHSIYALNLSLSDILNVLTCWAFASIFIIFRYNGKAGCYGYEVSTANILQEWKRPQFPSAGTMIPWITKLFPNIMWNCKYRFHSLRILWLFASGFEGSNTNSSRVCTAIIPCLVANTCLVQIFLEQRLWKPLFISDNRAVFNFQAHNCCW